MSDTAPQAPAPENKPIGFTPAPSAPGAAAAKLPSAPRFVSPMPKIQEVNEEIPFFLPILAGIAAIVTLAFTVLLYLKR